MAAKKRMFAAQKTPVFQTARLNSNPVELVEFLK
jgi:hypothetical protein